MVTVEVCIGSACYVKGSNEVVTILQKLIKEKGWEDQVNVKGAFCMQVCTQGLGLRVNGKQLPQLPALCARLSHQGDDVSESSAYDS